MLKMLFYFSSGESGLSVARIGNILRLDLINEKFFGIVRLRLMVR
jgi:hypothetical protein